MKIIPSDKVEFTTDLDINQVRENLTSYIIPERSFFSRFAFRKLSTNKTFEGSLLDDKFDLQLIINMNNSFLPQMSGKIETVSTGTKITSSLEIHKFVRNFLIIWLIAVGLSLPIIVYQVFSEGLSPFTLLVPVIMFFAGIGIIHFGYNMERDNSIKALKRAVNDEKIEYLKYNKK